MTDVTARPWWRWMVGMGIWRLSQSSGQIHYNRLTEAWPEPDDSGWCPTETDPATLGCLTQRARDLWGAPVCARVVGVFADGTPEWAACDLPGRDPMYGYRSEWAALVAACDAAPQR